MRHGDLGGLLHGRLQGCVGGHLRSLVLAAAGVIVATTAMADPVTGSPPVPDRHPEASERVERLRRALGPDALTYLEGKASLAGYLAPSQLDPRFTVALYVNVAAQGPRAQRMWVLQRDGSGGDWRLAMWDEGYWRGQGLAGSGLSPPYSWPVSSGKRYPGDSKSGPTPTGVFGLDERRWRSGRGYTAPGMINVMYLDLHYAGGRRSGVAFHGTTPGLYRRLGRIDSHGCIRMRQPNALAVLDRLQGRDGALAEEQRWGQVPRFWKYERGGDRFDYTRDGSMHPAATAATGSSDRATDAAEASPVLTKTGYRAVAVIFSAAD